MPAQSRQSDLWVPENLWTSLRFGLPRYQRTPEESLVDDPSEI
jgi:hypothetical protein